MSSQPSPEQLAEALKLLAKLQAGPAQQWLTDELYFKQFHSAVEQAKEWIEKDGSAPHVFFLWGRERDGDEWSVQPCMFADWPPPDGKKYEAMQGLGIMFAQKHPDHMLMNIIHISESWMARYTPEQSPPEGSHYLPKGVPTPSERKDRVECISISATSMDQRISFTNIPMLRDEAGKFTGWGDPIAEHLYKPGEVSNPRDNADVLAIHVLMGYFMASKAGRK